jgi:anti-sigma regulatory factor (Ser/Thr protein kinase)
MSEDSTRRGTEPERYRLATFMKGKRFELEVDSKLESLSIINDCITTVLKGIGAGDRSIFEVQMAVDEACTNIIQYAYTEQKGTITVICRLVNDDFTVTIRDRGKPFDPSSVPAPDLHADLDERRIGGLGIYFMRKMMDEVSYNLDAEGANELTMRKKLVK